MNILKNENSKPTGITMNEYDALLSKREIFSAQGNLSEALKCSEEMILKKPNDLKSHLFFLRDLEDFSLNISKENTELKKNIETTKENTLQNSSKIFPENLEIRIRQVRNLFKNEKFNESLEASNFIISSINNNFKEAYKIKLECLLKLFKIDEAKFFADEAIAKFEENLIFNQLLLQAYIIQGDIIATEKLCKSLIEKFPLHDKFHVEIINIKLIQKDYLGALEATDFAERNSIESFHIYLKAGTAAKFLQNRELSLYYHMKMISKFETQSPGYRLAIDDLINLCRFDEAEELLKIALSRSNCHTLKRYVESESLVNRKRAFNDFIKSDLMHKIPAISNASFLSLGPNCLPASMLNRASLRTTSMPFDWLICPAHHTLDILKTEFRYFLDNEYLFGYKASHAEVCGHKIYGPKLFWHHNPSIPAINNKFQERVVRFNKKLKSNESVVFLTIGSGSENTAIVQEIAENLKEKKFILKFDLLNEEIEIPQIEKNKNVITVSIPQHKKRSETVLNSIKKSGCDTLQGSELYNEYQSQIVDMVLRRIQGIPIQTT